MKGQRGQAFILVLILLAVGALTITPVLNYTSTALRSQRISEDIVTRDYAADSALEDVLRQMLDSIQGGVPPEESYDVEFGTGKWGVATVIEIPYVPPAEWLPYSSGHFAGVMVEVYPPFIDAGVDNPSYHYIIRVKLGKIDALQSFGFTLPMNVEYVDDSTYDLALHNKYLEDYSADPPEVNAVNVTSHEVQWNEKWGGTWQPMELGPNPFKSLSTDGRWELVWNVDIDSTVTGMYFVICNVTGYPPGGVSYIEPWFDGDFTLVEMEACGALGYGFYIVTIDVGGITYEVIVAYDSEANEGLGSWNIISYRIVG